MIFLVENTELNIFQRRFFM